MRMFGVVCWLVMLPAYAGAASLVADEIQQDAYGQIEARGHVQIQGGDVRIKASQLRIDMDSRAGSLRDATVYFPDFILRGDVLQRHDLEHFSGEQVVFSSCPEDEQAWAIVAKQAQLDREKGVFTAQSAWFEWGGVPVLYTPYWRSSLYRSSGFLMPRTGQSQVRGTEVSIPFYWAAAPHWDMTFTPRWMSLRGTMADIEWRHRTASSRAQVQLQAIDDAATQKQRGRLRTDVVWQASPTIRAMLNIDAVRKDDGLYVVDYPLLGENTSKSYLTSTASAGWYQGREHAVLSARYQQRLGGLSNDATLQVLPRFETRHDWDVGLPELLTIRHQTTRFDRVTGYSGLRSGIQAAVTLPWYMQGGAVTALWGIKAQTVGYDNQGFAQSTSAYVAVAGSAQLEAAFERVFASGRWRHEVKPVLRLDISDAPNQSDIPRYDAALQPLSMSNILLGNRYSGWDRFERMRRLSMLLVSSLEHKQDDGLVRRLLEGKLGVVWDDLRQSVDPAVDAPASYRLSNILAEAAWLPTPRTRLSLGGQFDSHRNDWVESHAHTGWTGERGQYLNISWQKTTPAHSVALESLTANAKAWLAARWYGSASVQYDMLRQVMLHNQLGIVYEHACWRMGIEGYQNAPVSSNGVKDTGMRVLLEFDGLGSFGKSS